ncbi:protein LYRIC [Protopterus annectens]|uniref:protein LYRIC n=1 Tax=Protopterus annectens TaxID=7888 RepID=UPI001CFC2A27|nr:protein LYRIC [Protopterus annectens]
MATRWQDVAAQQAEVAADHLRDLMTAMLGLLHSRFGLDLGIEPKQYQSWVLLLTAVLGLLVIVAVWVAACAGIIARSKRAGSSRQAAVASTESKLPSSRGLRVDDLKKKHKKKPTDKIKVNGRVEMPEDDLISFIQTEPLKQPLESEKKTEKVKNKKKKQKSDQKQGHETSPPDKKEADEGAWEKKVSNREKRQQRKREKAVDPGFDSSIEVATVVATEQVPSTIHVSSAPRKNRGEQSLNNQFSVVKSGKDDAVISQVSAGWNETPSVNGGSWSEIPGKRQTQIVCEDKWPSVQPATTGKKKIETCTWNSDAGDDSGTTADWSGSLRAKPWGQHTLFPPIDSWSNVDGRMNSSEQGSGSFPSLGLGPPLSGTTEPSTQPVVPDHQWDAALAPVEDEWSGLNGLSSADPSSDWNAPSEEWGHWVEEEAAPSPQIEEPVTSEVQKISDDEKEKVESTQHGSSSGKSKKKKKKKKKQGDDASSATPVQLDANVALFCVGDGLLV